MKTPVFDLKDQVARILRSYHHWLGKELIPLDAHSVVVLNQAPFAVLSHGIEVNPILNYGNQLALQLWEMDWAEFTRTPSRLTAEAPIREERARLLAEVSEKGYIDNYFGIRISKSGRRFKIFEATVWNLLDESGLPAGQAAVFHRWEEL